jgi:hypothetical protein
MTFWAKSLSTYTVQCLAHHFTVGLAFYGWPCVEVEGEKRFLDALSRYRGAKLVLSWSEDHAWTRMKVLEELLFGKFRFLPQLIRIKHHTANLRVVYNWSALVPTAFACSSEQPQKLKTQKCRLGGMCYWFVDKRCLCTCSMNSWTHVRSLA